MGVKRSSDIAKGLKAPPVGEFCEHANTCLMCWTWTGNVLKRHLWVHLADVHVRTINPLKPACIRECHKPALTCWLSAWPLCSGDRLKSCGDRLKMLKLPCERGELGSATWCTAVASTGAISAAASALCGPLCAARGPQHDFSHHAPATHQHSDTDTAASALSRPPSELRGTVALYSSASGEVCR